MSDGLKFYDEAELMLRGGRPDLASELYAKSYAANPRSPAAAIGLVKVGLMLEEIQPARELLDRVLKAFPNDAQAVTYRGLLDELDGNIEDALSHYEHAVTLDPNVALAHYSLGRVRAAQGQYSAAAGELRAAAKLEPDNATYWQALGHACAKGGEVEQAVEAWGNCLGLEPPTREIYLDIATALVTLGQEDLAESVLVEAEARFPRPDP